jgi:pyruvate dehydrogenase E1 component
MGDQVYYQGHAAPGVYARAFLEGRLSESSSSTISAARSYGQGLSSYPHPRSCPTSGSSPRSRWACRRWRPSTRRASTATCTIAASRTLPTRRVWAFLGDGETDEPESLGSLSIAAREGLDNLIFVVNCNLQRLDGPGARQRQDRAGAGGVFRGAGWNVIKVIWGREWDELLARDPDGVLVQRMNETLDGEWQRYAVEGRVHPRALLRHRSAAAPWWSSICDDELEALRRGGHDYRKLYAAYWSPPSTRARPRSSSPRR